MAGMEDAPQRLSAIGILVPELEPLVGPWRAKHDPSAGEGVGAHITLLAPFLPAELIIEDVVAELRAFFSGLPMPTLEFAGVCGFRNAVYLPPEPQKAISNVIRGLAARYPECPPYRGVIPIDDIIPHVSVAFSDDPRELERISAEFCRNAASHLPIAADIRHALLIVQDEDYVYQTRGVLPFGVPPIRAT
jgi:hypothetical protein